MAILVHQNSAYNQDAHTLGMNDVKKPIVVLPQVESLRFVLAVGIVGNKAVFFPE